MDLSLERKKIIVDTLKEEIPALQALYIFGSYADGSATQKSDIDIAYLSLESISSTVHWEISQLLARILDCDIDLIQLQETNTVFRFQIISKAERIYCIDNDTVDRFETLTFSFYLRFQEERQPIIDAIYADAKVLHVS